MKNELVKFAYEAKDVRTVVDENNEIWFVGTDVCSILGYANSRKALERLDEDERKQVSLEVTHGLHPHTIFISESGLYNLLLTSKMESAKTFKKWVRQLLLPTVRKHTSVTGKLGILPEHIEDYFVKRKKLREERDLLRKEVAETKASNRTRYERLNEIERELDELDEVDRSQLKLEI